MNRPSAKANGMMNAIRITDTRITLLFNIAICTSQGVVKRAPKPIYIIKGNKTIVHNIRLIWFSNIIGF